jgi:hypothetical protein
MSNINEAAISPLGPRKSAFKCLILNEPSRQLMVCIYGLIFLPVVVPMSSPCLADGEAEDGVFKTACGPIACYIALTRLNVDCTLRDVCDNCNWSPGKLTKLKQLIVALQHYGVSCSAMRLNPGALRELLYLHPDCVAILAVRREGDSLDHVICALDANSESFLTADYPVLLSSRSDAELAKIWDGHAIIVCRRSNYLWIVVAGSVPGLALGFILCVVLRPSVRRIHGSAS